MTSDQSPHPRLILVTGPAGSGKTTLGHALARRVGCPALSRDELKEGMVLSHPGFVPTTSDPLTMRTYELFFTTIDNWLASGVTLVAEAAFQDRLWRPVLTPLLAAADVRVIRCTAARGRTIARPAHPGTPVGADDWVPIALPVPTLTVATDDGWAPTVPEIIAWLGQG